jgi:hypothetical protein
VPFYSVALEPTDTLNLGRALKRALDWRPACLEQVVDPIEPVDLAAHSYALLDVEDDGTAILFHVQTRQTCRAPLDRLLPDIRNPRTQQAMHTRLERRLCAGPRHGVTRLRYHDGGALRGYSVLVYDPYAPSQPSQREVLDTSVSHAHDHGKGVTELGGGPTMAHAMTSAIIYAFTEAKASSLGGLAPNNSRKPVKAKSSPRDTHAEG